MTATDDRLRIAFSFESAIMMANPAVKCSSVSPNMKSASEKRF
jgi:hypothetical protein